MRSALAFLRPFVSGSRSRRVLARLESQDVEDPAMLFGLFGLLGHASAPAVLYLACLLPHPPRHVDLPGIRRAYRAHAAAALACMATPVLLARSPPAVRAPAPLRRAFQAYARDEFLALLPLLHAQFAALRVATAALGPADFDLLVRGRASEDGEYPERCFFDCSLLQCAADRLATLCGCPGALTDDLDTAEFKGRRPRALLGARSVWALAEVLGAWPLPALGVTSTLGEADLGLELARLQAWDRGA
ncbi:hypothetical protein SS50377_24056 [Spironucleus salmonicida]|uniref:Uncharacterized protein n=1 Tax=Spironucleus salmonicida TaxID=348837 RepID=A0A9P8LTV3_9EUKA|nr:hypothetical protein SS50377_24056 [Spironucleus salmonicida]